MGFLVHVSWCTCASFFLGWWFSKMWSQHQIPQELARNEKSRLPLQTYWIGTARRGVQRSVLTGVPTRCANGRVRFENHELVSISWSGIAGLTLAFPRHSHSASQSDHASLHCAHTVWESLLSKPLTTLSYASLCPSALRRVWNGTWLWL